MTNTQSNVYYNNYIQGDFESCADILTSDRTSQKVTIEPKSLIQMLIFFEKKGLKV
jgi:hypothetical protein